MLHFKQGLPWIAAGFVAIAGASPSQAQGGAEFFKGKTVTYIVATAPGGGYDAYGRLVAEYMQKHLPGSTFVVKNMPGAGHVIGANAIYAAKPDGLTIGTFNTGLIYNQLIGLEGVTLRPDQDVVDRQGGFRSARHHLRRALADQDLRGPARVQGAGQVRDRRHRQRLLCRDGHADQRAAAACQGPDRLQRQRGPARHAPQARSTARSPRAPPTSSSSTTNTAASSPRSAAPTRTCRSWRRSSPTRRASS